IWNNFYCKDLMAGYDNTFINIIAYDGFIYAIGQTAEQASQGTDFIVKTNLNGDVIWYKTFRTNNNDITCSKFFVYKNTFIAYGYHEQREKRPILLNNYIMCVDTTGELLWEKEHFKNNGESEYRNIFPVNKNRFLGISAVSNNFKYGKDSVLFEGTLICKLDSNFNILEADTLLRDFNTKTTTSDYNFKSKKIAIHLNHWVRSDSVFCQIALLDSTGKVEKIIDDPQNFTPSCLIAYKDGWVKNYNTILIQYDSNYNEVRRFAKSFGDEGYFKSSYLSLVNNGKDFLLAGKGRACNPYDDNPESHYDRPTAFMIDTNFIDYGMAQPAPVKYNAIKAFPNPATESITLQITNTEAEYTVNNSVGMFVSSGKMQSSTEIPLANISSGIYFIHIKSLLGDNIGSVKFVKKE
ncbi:MAG: T9SS type A sorting domain-containing protein, partial [Bacteroidetes bacterium]|nr:T9SS type A sorting domain-containing protein [Bacteroidota bacterium]